jgi:hypothetical protein
MVNVIGCRDLAGAEGIVEATEPSAKRKLLSVVPDAQREANIKKLPLISHKAAANRNDAFIALAALWDGATSMVVLLGDWPP